MILLFDAANTIIHKPDLYINITKVLTQHNFNVEEAYLKKNHKLLSEVINFPDRTNEEFYKKFNSELLYCLGIAPTEALLKDIFTACSYLPWKAFDDTKVLKELNVKKAIVSNFHSSLTKIIAETMPNTFDEIVISEVENLRKPDIEFYKCALKYLKVPAEEIIYIGDSVKLDIEPASKLGIKAFLIDRENNFLAAPNRLTSLHELKNFSL